MEIIRQILNMGFELTDVEKVKETHGDCYIFVYKNDKSLKMSLLHFDFSGLYQIMLSYCETNLIESLYSNVPYSDISFKYNVESILQRMKGNDKFEKSKNEIIKRMEAV